MGNIHIQKMQAAMATLDWLSMKIPGSNIWSLLNKPQTKRESLDHLDRMLHLITAVIEQHAWQLSWRSICFTRCASLTSNFSVYRGRRPVRS